MEARLDQLQLVLKTIAKQGNPQSPYWFMGLEESTDPNYTADQQILTQYQTASEQAAGKIIPLSYARVRKAYQPTWGGYIKLLLSVRDAVEGPQSEWTTNDVLHYQRNVLGDSDIQEYSTCLLELSPLPRKTRGHPWVYGDIADRPGMEFLSSYESFSAYQLVKDRASLIIDEVENYKPRVLFVFGKDGEFALRDKVEDLVSYEVVKSDSGRSMPAYIGTLDSTLVVFSYHPAYRPITTYWRRLGAIAAGKLPPSNDTLVKAAEG